MIAIDRASTPAGRAHDIDDLRFRARATPDAATSARHRLDRWASRLDIPRETLADLLLAGYEAVANVVEHAYPDRADGEFELHATYDRTGSLVLTVTDHGQWRPPPADPGTRGRGLLLIRSLAEAEITVGADGTSVRMTLS